MSDMADAIFIHSQIGQNDKGQYCKGCGYRYGGAAGVTLKRKASEHIAAALSAAGFGPVQEARAEVWDEGFAKGSDWGEWAAAPVRYQPDFTNPYRKDT